MATRMWIESVADGGRQLVVAVRSLRCAPGFSAAVILTIALAVSTAVTIYAVGHGVLLRPLPYSNPKELVLLHAERSVAGQPTVAAMRLLPSQIANLRERTRSLASVAGFTTETFALSVDGQTETVRGARVSGDFFSTLGGELEFGRTIGLADDQLHVVVISEELWLRRYGGTAMAVGRQAILDAKFYTIVGVADASLRFPDAKLHHPAGDTDVWIPLGLEVAPAPDESWRETEFDVVARLTPGFTNEEASVELSHVVEALSEWDVVAPPRRVRAVGLHQDMVATARPALLLLFAAAALLLAVACTSVAGLILARQVARGRERAVRLALGATEQQLVVESLAQGAVLSVAGGVIGAILATWASGMLMWLVPPGLSPREAVTVGGPPLLLALILIVAVTLWMGVLPVLVPSLQGPGLAVGARGSRGKREGGLRRALVVGQLAMACMLLVGAGLLVRSMVNLLDKDIGVVTDGVLVASMDLSSGRTLTGGQRVELVDRLLTRIRRLPGVRSAGVGTAIPPTGSIMRGLYRHPDGMAGQSTEFLLDVVPTTSGFLTALGVPVLSGRLLTPADALSGRRGAVLNETVALRMFGDKDPIGQTLSMSPESVTVVGVVGDVSNRGLAESPDNTLYVPYADTPFPSIKLVVRTDEEVSLAAQTLRQTVAAVDQSLAVTLIRPLSDVLRELTDRPRLRSVVLSALAGVALMLSCTALYGLLAYNVSLRFRDYAIRLALGATRSAVGSMVLREGMTLTAPGIVVGLVGAWAFSRALGGLLFGVQTADGVPFVWASALLIFVTLLASIIPAFRATQAEPATALRVDD